MLTTIILVYCTYLRSYGTNLPMLPSSIIIDMHFTLEDSTESRPEKRK